MAFEHIAIKQTYINYDLSIVKTTRQYLFRQAFTEVSLASVDMDVKET